MADYTLQYTAAEIDNRLGRPVPVNQGGTGQTQKYTSVPVTNITSTATNHSVYVRYSAYLGACFIRFYAQITNTAVPKYTWIDVCSVPSEYRPSSTWALAASMYGGADARILSSGVVQVKSNIDIPANDSYDIYISGVWVAD